MDSVNVSDHTEASVIGQGQTVNSIAKYWWGFRRRFAAIMPGWPIILSSFVILYIMFGTGQGRQAVRAVLSDNTHIYLNWPLLSAFLAMVAHGVIAQGAFLMATSHQEDFNGEKLRLHRFQRWFAFLTALIVPSALAGFIFWLDGVFQAQADRQVPIDVLVATGGVIVFIAMLNAVLIRAYTRIRENSFGQIVSIDGKYRRLIYALFFAVLTIGFVQQFWFAFLTALGPIALIVTAFTLIGFMLGIAVAAIRSQNLPALFFFLIGFAFLSSAFARFFPSGYHDFETVDAVDTAKPAQEHAIQWLVDRDQALKDSNKAGAPINAIVVLAEGGGIYAARNSAGFLTRLDVATCGDFYSHLYGMSGVSGGSVGLAAYLAARADGLIENSTKCGGQFPADAPAKIHKFLGSDFLSPIASGLLFRDIPLRFLPVSEAIEKLPFPRKAEDRARMFEAEFTRRWRMLVCPAPCKVNRFEQDFLAVVNAAHTGMGQHDEKANVGKSNPTGPVILFNTTRVDNGQAEIVSNVLFDKVHSKTDARPLYNVLERLSQKRQSIPIGAAAHMSARFPLVSPTAILRIKNKDGHVERHSYVDGGYLDNSGAVTALRAVDELRLAANKLDAGQACGDAKELLKTVTQQREADKEASKVAALISQELPIDQALTSGMDAEFLLAQEAVNRNCYADRLNFVVLHFYSRTLKSAEAAESEANPKSLWKRIFVEDSNAVGTHWFKEITNPFVAILKARGARGQGAVEALCRSAIAKKDAGSQKVCREMQVHRKAMPAGPCPRQSSRARENHKIEYCIPEIKERDEVVSAKHAKNLNWINAPIDIGEDPRSDEFVPLGWFLGPDSNGYMLKEEKRRAPEVCVNLKRALGARWNCNSLDAS